MIVFFIFTFLVWPSRQDYIRSDELILNDNLEIGSEIINLNKLLNTEEASLQIKIVNDTSLVNYIDLDYINSGNTLIILKKRINFEEICDSSLHQIESLARSQSTILACSQTLRIVAINENNFIEIPVQIRKINENLVIRKKELNLKFSQSILNLNLSGLENSFYLDYPLIQIQQVEDLNFIKEKIFYNISNLDPQVSFKFQLKQEAKNLKLTINFADEKSLLKAYDQNLVFRLRLDAFLLTDIYELKSNATQSLFVRVTELKKLNLKPLDFEMPIYSISLENNNLNLNDLILEPKLKETSPNEQIVFSLFQNEEQSVELPFYVEESSGAIRLKKEIWSEQDEEYLSKNLNKLFLFGIKATYKRLNEYKKSTKTNYYYDYMIPAFAKVQVSITSKKIQPPSIKSHIISPFVSKYEILNEESANQTFIFYINDPFPANSKLVTFLIDSNLTWLLEEEEEEEEEEKSNFLFSFETTNLTLVNRFEFKDQQSYKTKLKLKRQRILAQVNVEFRVDFDPLLFEKPEYIVYLSQSDLVEQNLIKIKLKDRLKSKLDQQNLDNVLYRLSDLPDSDLFDINPLNGWLSARKVLTRKNVYDLEVIAINTDLQKSAIVKCKIIVECGKIGKQVQESVKFSLFENSPNRTQVGTFWSVCSDLTYSYEFDSSLSVNICPKQEFNCKTFDLDGTDLRLFSLDSENGYLMTNTWLNLSYLVSLIKQDYEFANFEDLNLIFESNTLSIILKASIQTSLRFNLKYKIEISIQNAPKLINFTPGLIISQSAERDLSESANEYKQIKCLYNYKYSTNGSPVDAQFKKSSFISRFVRIDQNMAHLEAEFKVADECSAKIFIQNNGCLSLRYDHLILNASASNSKCQPKQNRTDLLLLKSGTYNLLFKLCYYNNNKVSCSQFYNQTLFISNDLYRNSRVITNALPEVDKMHLLNSDRNGSFNLMNKSNLSTYLFVLIGVICFIALIAIVSLVVIFARPKYKNSIKSPSEKALVFASKKEIDFKSLELSTDETNRTRSNVHTPDTSSNAPTTSSKIAKTDDETEDEVRIKVMDDCVANSIKYSGYTNNNFSYAGSFSSIGSSYESSHLTDEGIKIKNSPRLENEHGLYSVKNASIQFSSNNANNPSTEISNLSSPKDYDIYDTSSSKPGSLNGDHSANIYNGVLVNANYSSSSNQISAQQQAHQKTSSLKKIKKEIALKKAAYSNLVDANNTSNNNSILYETTSYGYLNSNEILLTPNDIIASIV